MALRPKSMTDEDWTALRFELGQLFTPSTPIGAGELFAGRINQIKSLIDTVSERGRHAIIYGEPGVGKTSVAQVLQFFVPRDTSTVKYIRRAVFSSDDYSVPIRLSPIPTTSRVLPIPRVKLGLGRAAISPAMSSAS